MQLRWVVCLALAAAGVAGCSSDELTGECSAKVGYDDRVYRPTNGLHTPRRGAELGDSPYLGCDGEVADGLGTIRLYEVAGEDPREVVLAVEMGEDTVYIDESMPWAERPEFLKDSEHYVTCTGPARFTGTWRWIEPEDLPNSEDYDPSAAPYTATFRATRGIGVGLDRWAVVSLQAEVGVAAGPVPDADLFRRATVDHEPVRVVTRCRDGEFEVASIRITGPSAASVG